MCVKPYLLVLEIALYLHQFPYTKCNLDIKEWV